MKRKSISNISYDSKSLKFYRNYRIPLLILIILAIIPILSVIFNIGLVSLYNTMLSTVQSSFDWLQSIISLFYSTILILLFIVIASNLIIKFIQYIVKKQPFSKLKNQNFHLLSKFFKYQKGRKLILVVILGLQLGFINFYYIRNYNQYLQNEFEVYTEFGSDFKFYDSYKINNSLTMSNYIDQEQYCEVRSVPGRIVNDTIFDQNIALVRFDPENYEFVLDKKVKNAIDPDLISNIINLKGSKIIVPYYLKLRYGLKIGDYLVVQPENVTDYENNSYVENYSIPMQIKGFFNNLPGLDRESTIFSTSSSQRQLIIITSQNFNFSLEFPKIAAKSTFLIIDTNNIKDILNIIKNDYPGTYYKSLQNSLIAFNDAYLSVSRKHTIILYNFFIIIFLLMTFLFIYIFIVENSDFWQLFQLFGLKEKAIKKFTFSSLISIFIISFLIGLTGIFIAILTHWLSNIYFVSYYYIYPIQIDFNFLSIIYNLLYIAISFVVIWILTKKVFKFKLSYQYLRKYNRE